jgi:hypothetical protein
MRTLITVVRRGRARLSHGRDNPGRDAGMSTAEYAVGTVAACGFGGVLYKVVTSAAVTSALSGLIHRALSAAF